MQVYIFACKWATLEPPHLCVSNICTSLFGESQFSLVVLQEETDHF